MVKKLTYDFVKEQFEKEGYTLLSKEYKNSKTKLKYRCPVGHIHSITWNGWCGGYRCPYCAGNKKLTIGFVTEQFEKESYVLLAKEYINSQTKLDYECPKGHRHKITWNSWLHGVRCPYCSRDVKPTIDFIKTSFEKEGYILLSTEYISGSTKLDCICPKNHTYSIAWTNWLSGHRCSTCMGNKKFTFDEVINLFEKEGCILLSSAYFNSKQKLKYKCPEGHINTVSLSNWNQGARCRECQKDKIYTSFRKDLYEIEQSFISEGWGVDLSTYKNIESKLVCVCPQNHIQTKTWKKWKKGQRCNICYNIMAIGENSPNWKGGKSLEPYCEAWRDREYKQDIRERDGNVCLNPYCHGNGGVLSIHHIDYNKKNCHPSNLITVCRSCNLRANHDREWHEAWYKAIMYRRYNYDYN